MRSPRPWRERRLQVLERLHGLRLEVAGRAGKLAARVDPELARKEDDAGIAPDLDDVAVARRLLHRRRIEMAQDPASRSPSDTLGLPPPSRVD
jgi:hypothetical protein